MRTTLENKLGFTKVSGPHEMYKLSDDSGKFVIEVGISHGTSGKDIPKGTFGAIARRMYLSKEQLEDAVRCPLSHEDYYRILKRKGFSITSDVK